MSHPHPVPLPIDEVIPDLVSVLHRHRAVVLQAPPGAGKTTRVPLALRDAGLLPAGSQLLLLEPRRIAARAAAMTMARAVGDEVGGTVGYHVRFDRKASARTQVLVVTEGILTRRFADDPFLDGISVVVLDEFHERSVHTDLCLALVKELLSVRDDLKLIVMSATLDAAAVAAYLDGCPVITSAGRPYPVVIKHAERRPKDADRPAHIVLTERVAGALRTVMASSQPGFADDGGDVLCFLPGAGEIDAVRRRVSESPLPGDPDVIALFGAMGPAEQDRALRREVGGRRRVILATNVAETSLTIDGVTTVVDSGLMKSLRWDSGSDRERLELVSISQASAEQRAGRAGRTRPGRCLRLWTEAEHHTLHKSHPPELHRVELSRPLLDVALFTGSDPRRFVFFETPPPSHLEHAVSLLQRLGALDEQGAPTAHARALARLPVSPRAAAVLHAAAELDVVDDAAAAMAVLEDDRALHALLPRAAHASTDSDVQGLLERLPDHMRQVPELRRAVAELVRLAPKATSRAPAALLARGPGVRLKAALLRGFPDRLCRRRRAGEPDAAMVGGRGARLAPSSGVLHDELFIALSLEGRGTAPLVAVAEGVPESVLKDAMPSAITTVDEAVLDEARGAFMGVRRTRVFDLVIDERSGVPVSDDAVAVGLAAAFVERFERLWAPSDGARSLIERLRFARHALPDAGYPDVSDAALKTLVPDVCKDLVRAGERRLDDVVAADWSGAVRGLLDWELARRLDDDVPAKLTVPTGNSITVDYGPALNGAAPVLAVRLQECFGWLDTPRVARDRVAVVLHLLSPGYKPVQVTTDLRSFWAKGYKEVKAELRARYPKHAWPDDPLTATPVAKGRSTKR